MYNDTDSISSEDIEEPEYIKKAEIKAVVKPVYKKPEESAWTTVISKKKENKKKKKGRK